MTGGTFAEGHCGSAGKQANGSSTNMKNEYRQIRHEARLSLSYIRGPEPKCFTPSLSTRNANPSAGSAPSFYSASQKRSRQLGCHQVRRYLCTVWDSKRRSLSPDKRLSHQRLIFLTRCRLMRIDQ